MLVEEHGGDKGTRTLSMRTQFTALAYGQLSQASSLREIESAVQSHEARLYHLNARPVKRSALADANASRPAAVHKPTAAKASLLQAVALLEKADGRDESPAPLLARYPDRAARASRYAEAYRRYSWPVASIDNYRIAPFHLCAIEGALHIDKDQLWHMGELSRLTATGDKMIVATANRLVNVEDTADLAAAVDWWTGLTDRRRRHGAEAQGFHRLGRERASPACGQMPGGREYLRVIYGSEYDAPENLERLRSRSLGKKRSLALREFALGHEALRRFIGREPLRRVHEAVFAILALESEPLDPRL